MNFTTIKPDKTSLNISKLIKDTLTTDKLNLTHRTDLEKEFVEKDPFGLDGLTQNWLEIYQNNDCTFTILVDADEDNLEPIYRLITMIQDQSDYFCSFLIVRA